MRRVVLAVTAALVLAACSSPPMNQPGTSAPIEPTGPTAATTTVFITADDLPAIVPLATTEEAVPQRIVSLATGVGETLGALGVGDRVVGRDETSDVDALSQVPIVTAAHSVSAERVLDLEPDLVLIDARTTPSEALDQIAASGVRLVEVPEAWTLSDISPRIEAVAAAVGVDARPLLDGLPSDTTPEADAPRVAFLYLRGTAGIYLLGGAGSGADSIIAAAGGIDVGAQAGYDAFIPMTAEALATLNPDVLIVMTKGLDSVNGIEGLVALPGVAQTTAGRERRVIVVDDAILLSFGPRTPALIEELREAITQVSP
jgi:iron complex transport system substrate-binding protein